MTELPLRRGAAGESVRDIQRRLAAAGFDVSADGPGTYGPATEQAVRQFQERRGLRCDGICGEQTWASLVEAGYHLGDRMLYLHAPLLRGDDIAELQRTLGALGFDAGRVDGILGPHTAEALEEFQRNAGLTSDGICGPDTLAELRRYASRVGKPPTVAHVREIDRLRDAERDLSGVRVVVGESGGLSALATAVARALVAAGAIATVLHDPDESSQASQANATRAAAFIGLALRDEPGARASYYSAEGFESIGGRRLARLTLDELPRALAPSLELAGMRLPVLRETRMPAVVFELGPPALVVEHSGELAEALSSAVMRWVRDPLEPSS